MTKQRSSKAARLNSAPSPIAGLPRRFPYPRQLRLPHWCIGGACNVAACVLMWCVIGYPFSNDDLLRLLHLLHPCVYSRRVFLLPIRRVLVPLLMRTRLALAPDLLLMRRPGAHVLFLIRLLPRCLVVLLQSRPDAIAIATLPLAAPLSTTSPFVFTDLWRLSKAALVLVRLPQW